MKEYKIKTASMRCVEREREWGEGRVGEKETLF